MTTSVPSEKRPRVHLLPITPLGWWAVGLAVAGIVLTNAWQIMPGGGWAGFGVTIMGGVFALVAIVRDNERALAVFAAVLPMLFVVWMIAVELLSLTGVLPEH